MTVRLSQLASEGVYFRTPHEPDRYYKFEGQRNKHGHPLVTALRTNNNGNFGAAGTEIATYFTTYTGKIEIIHNAFPSDST